jgi:hypothetical protein
VSATSAHVAVASVREGAFSVAKLSDMLTAGVACAVTAFLFFFFIIFDPTDERYTSL